MVSAGAPAACTSAWPTSTPCVGALAERVLGGAGDDLDARIVEADDLGAGERGHDVRLHRVVQPVGVPANVEPAIHRREHRALPRDALAVRSPVVVHASREQVRRCVDVSSVGDALERLPGRVALARRGRQPPAHPGTREELRGLRVIGASRRPSSRARAASIRRRSSRRPRTPSLIVSVSTVSKTYTLPLAAHHAATSPT
jgi:hypothetical protein